MTDFEFAAGRGGWEGLEEFNLSLTIDNTRVVELGDTRDLNGFAGLVVVNYFLGVLLKRKDNGVGREYGKLGVKLLLFVSTSSVIPDSGERYVKEV